MITTLAKLKERLSLIDASKDALLTQIILGVGARFDSETSRTLARTVDAVDEFPANALALSLRCYPVEAITKFETKTTEALGWVEATPGDMLLHEKAVLRFDSALGLPGTLARVTYTGGYVMPGDVPAEGQTPLPPVLEAAAIEQAAMWYQLQGNVGIFRVEATTGTYLEVADRYWVPWVRTTLRRYRRLLLT